MGHALSKSSARQVVADGDGNTYERRYEVTGLTGHRYPTEKEVADELAHLQLGYLRGTLHTQVKDNRDGSYEITCRNSRPWLENEVAGLEKEFKRISKERGWAVNPLSATIPCGRAQSVAI